MGWDIQTWLQVILAIVQIIVMLALLWYAWETREMRQATQELVKETKQSREMLIAPKLQLSVRDVAHKYRYVMANVGNGVADDIAISVKRRRVGDETEETVVPSVNPENNREFSDRFPALYPLKWRTAPELEHSIYDPHYRYLWYFYTQFGRDEYHYKLEGTYRNALGTETSITWVFDSRGAALGKEQY